MNHPRFRVLLSAVAALAFPLGAIDAASIDASLVQTIEPIPEVHSVSPDLGPLGGGQTVTITGRSFQNVYAVAFGLRHAQFVINDPNTITAVSPPADEPGTVYIVVKTHQTYAWLPSSYTYIDAFVDDSVIFVDGFESGTIETWTGGASE